MTLPCSQCLSLDVELQYFSILTFSLHRPPESFWWLLFEQFHYNFSQAGCGHDNGYDINSIILKPRAKSPFGILTGYKNLGEPRYRHSGSTSLNYALRESAWPSSLQVNLLFQPNHRDPWDRDSQMYPAQYH